MGMPIPSAARSLSRMATKARPNRVRTRFSANQAAMTPIGQPTHIESHVQQRVRAGNTHEGKAEAIGLGFDFLGQGKNPFHPYGIFIERLKKSPNGLPTALAMRQ